MGRRSKLTPEVQEKICEYVRLGATYEVAARAAGIDESTFYRWKALGEKARSGKYREFFKALRRAEAEGETHHLEVIASEGPTGSKWILARRHPERWGDRMRHEVKTDVGDALAEILERLADRGGAEDD